MAGYRRSDSESLDRRPSHQESGLVSQRERVRCESAQQEQLLCLFWQDNRIMACMRWTSYTQRPLYFTILRDTPTVNHHCEPLLVFIFVNKLTNSQQNNSWHLIRGRDYTHVPTCLTYSSSLSLCTVVIPISIKSVSYEHIQNSGHPAT